jgi:uncharacterized protein DUF6494
MTAELDEDRFNMAIRIFLKHVGVTSQREIENLVRSGVSQAGLRDHWRASGSR